MGGKKISQIKTATTTPTQLNTHFKSKADSLLTKYDLTKLLSTFGNPLIIGSYQYNLMAWKELDLILEVSEPNLNNIYNIVSIIGKTCKPTQLKTHDYLFKPKHGYLYGFWIGIYLDGWKVDVWILEKAGIAQQIKQMDKIKQMITPEYRDLIVTIKSDLATDPNYHKKFSSLDLYNAVCKSRIKTTKEFYEFISQVPNTH